MYCFLMHYRLRGSVLRFLFVLLCLVIHTPVRSANEKPTLTHCLDVRMLPREEAANGLRVHLRGVVIYIEQNGQLVIQDETGGIYVGNRDGALPEAASARPKVGNLVEIEGHTVPGGFIPMVIPEVIRLVGVQELPAPKDITPPLMNSGRWSSQRVALICVVQRCKSLGTANCAFQLDVATPNSGFSVTIQDGAGVEAANLVDARVRVIGVNFYTINSRGEILSSHIRCQSLADVTILKEPISDPFAAPEVSPFALNPFRVGDSIQHRQRLTGVVTYYSNKEFMYVQMKERGVRVNIESSEPLELGDEVEVSGFVTMQQSYGIMTNAIYRKTGHTKLPTPIKITWQKVLSVHTQPVTMLRQEDYDGTRVSIAGELVSIEHQPDQDHRLFLECSGRVIVATLRAACPPSHLERFSVGSQLDVTGICSVNYGATAARPVPPLPESFFINLQSPDDVIILSVPKPWAEKYLAYVFLAPLAALLFMLAITEYWRHQVARSNARLTKEIEARQESEHARQNAELELQATLRERQRLAGDLHDTIEQSLTGVALQIDAARRAPNLEDTTNNLAVASTMLTQSREEVRRSVWNLRAQALDGKLLREALTEVAGQFLKHRGIVLHVGGRGEEVPLPPLISSNLFMLAKEALSNAVKHGAPKRIDISVDYAPSTVTLIVHDDGQGFEPSTAKGPDEGHYGLAGMRERATRFGGLVRVTSHPGQGTKVFIHVQFSDVPEESDEISIRQPPPGAV